MSTSVLFDAPGPKARRRARILSIVGIIAIAALVAWIIFVLASPRVTANGVVQPGVFDPSRWDIFTDLALWRGVGTAVINTLRMAGVAAAGAIAVGILFSFGRTANTAWVRVPVTVVLEFFRGMPVLLMMLFILLIFRTGSYWAGVLALAIYNGAIIGEILRAGIASLPKGQRESGLAIGLTPVQTRMRIEFPQAFRQMLPIIIAQLVVLLKDTSLAYIISYPEILRYITNNLSNYYGNRYFFPLFFLCFAIYLALNLTLSFIARRVAKRTAGGYVKGGKAKFEDPNLGLAKAPDAGMGGGGPV